MKKRIYDFLIKYRDDCKRLKKAFYDFEKNKWNTQTYCLELLIQLGHYIYVSMDDRDLKNNIKEEFRNLNDIVDEICDVIYQVINVLNECNILIEKPEDIFDFQIPSEKNQKETCVVLAGEIADAVLRKTEYKHNNNRYINQEDVLILKNCSYILYCIFSDIEKKNINIEESFGLMIKDAWNYINSFDDKSDGLYSKIKKEHVIIKDINPYVVNQMGIKYSDDIISLIYDYTEQLDLEIISVVKPLLVQKHNDNIRIVQPAIQGLRLDKFLDVYSCKDDSIVFAVFRMIIDDLILLYYKNSNVRVDSNICNFIIDNRNDSIKIYLVDIYPPILKNKMIGEEDNFIFSLMTDINVSINAFIYYYIRTIVKSSQLNSKTHNLIENIINYAKIKGFCELNKFTKDSKEYCYIKYFVEKIYYMLNCYDKPEVNESLITINKWTVRKELLNKYEL